MSIDMRTIILNQVIASVLGTIIIALLWQQYRHRFAGLGLWLADFAIHTLAMVLFVLRGVIPVWLSIMVGNAFLAAGLIFFYMGLVYFFEQPKHWWRQGFLLGIFIAVHAYFTFIQPNLGARNINASLAILIILLQCLLLMQQLGKEFYPITKWASTVFVGYFLISAACILANLFISPVSDFLQNEALYEGLLMVAYQVLVFATILIIFMLINRRLFLNVEMQQQSLQESEARYRQLVELSPDAIVVYRDQAIVFANSAAAKLLGAASPEVLLGRSAIEFVHPDFRAVAQQRVAQVLSDGEPAPLLEERFIRLDGRILDVEVITGRLEYQGRPALQTIARDITERKRAEMVLRLRLQLVEFAAEHSLEALMQRALDEIGALTQSPIGFYHFVEEDQQTLSLQAWSTRTIEEFFQAEGEGRHYPIDQAGVWVDCVRERRPIIHNDYAALPHRKGLPPGHAEIKRELVVPTLRNGHIVSILGVGNKPEDYNERDVALVAYVADVIWSIVERKRSEEQLQLYQQRLETQNLKLRKLSRAIEQSASTILITDPEGTIEYVNPAFTRITGYTVEEAQGQNPRVLKSGHHPPEFYRNLWQTITRGEIWYGELLNRRKDGSLYWESAAIAPVLDAEGRVTHYIAIKEDITARKEAEEALRHYAEQLELQNAELDAFAHTVAHDLKNPLGTVIGYLGFLWQTHDTMTLEERTEALETVLHSSEKLQVIVDELLLLASVRKDEVIAEPLAMGAVVQEACDRLRLALEKAQAQLVTPEPATWPKAFGHAPWVEEVWVNYISNALKYGGDPPRIELGWDQREGQASVRFWVRDDGAGLTPEAQAKLFTEFTRLGQVRAKGYGLGLSIVRRIVEKLGGEVGVESAVGEGSTFWFTLPRDAKVKVA